MSRYEIDLHLPVDVMRRAPFILVGPDSRFLPLGILADSVGHGGKQLQRVSPLVLSRMSDKAAEAQIFCFAFFYVNDQYRRVLLLTHPIEMNESVSEEALEALLAEAERIAGLLNCSIIEVELHHQVEGPVAFPTSFSLVSYDLARAMTVKADADLFRRIGFEELTEVNCFEGKISDLEIGPEDVNGKRRDQEVSPVSPGEYFKFIDKGSFDIRSFEISRWDSAFKTTSPPNFPCFEDTTFLAQRRSRLGFLKGSGRGYIHWAPNIMEPFNLYHTPHILLFYHVLEQYFYECGKVIEWGLGSEDRSLLSFLLFRAVESMKERGIRRVQFANVEGSQSFMRSYLNDKGFNLIHRIKLLQKEVD